jgi:microcystin-dependent protein
MGTPFLGQISIFAFNFAPKGFSMCNGQLLPINQNQALFALLGTFYGGNGQSTFALPNLQSRTPISFGQGPGLQNYVQGQAGGEENHTLLSTEMPQHNHSLQATTNVGNTRNPSGAALCQPDTKMYISGAPDTSLAASSVASYGGSQPHFNLQPYLTINFCIAMTGIFPSRN